ncbi:MAG TPA: hypothetical protein VMV18_00565, partial [bacterium]|nr:hypothetical protein [bacterium]
MGRSAAAAAFVLALASAAASGCGGKSHGCGSAGGTFPADATVLQWDNGTAAASIRGQHFSITVGNQTLKLDTEPMWEAVRFDLAKPATIYGFQVVWNNLAT